MKSNPKILIITGGIDSERKISLLSAKNVKSELEKTGYKVKLFDLKKGYRELKTHLKKYDLVFPVIHGEQGEGGELQKFLTEQKAKFVGGDWRGYKKGWYKIPFKKFCDQNNIPTARWKIVKSKADIVLFGFPCVLKSSNGNNEIVIKSVKDLDSHKIQKFLQQPSFIEEYMVGKKFDICVLQTNSLSVEMYPTTQSRFKEAITELSLKIHRFLNLGYYSQISFITTDGEVSASHIQNIPKMTPDSLFIKTLKRKKITVNDLLLNL